MYSHDTINLRRTAAEWRTNILHTEALVTPAAELQAQVAALESKLANLTEELGDTLVPKASGWAQTNPQDSSQAG